MTMVKEKRIVFDVGDIAAARLQCTKCKAEVVLAFRETLELPKLCPRCELPWRGFAANDKVEKLIALLTAPEKPTRTNGPTVSMRFEMDAKTDRSPSVD